MAKQQQQKKQFTPPSPPPPPPPSSSYSTKKKPKQKWIVTLPNSNTLDFSSLRGISNIDQVKTQWHHATACVKPDNGRGVYIIQLEKHEETELVIVKGSSTIVQDLFAGELARTIDVNVPAERMVAYNNGTEWSTIKDVIKRVGSPEIEASATKELNRAFFVVMEYISGIALDHFDDVQLIFNNSTNININIKQNILKDIGHIVVFDVLVNNWDRIPSGIWDNEGNLGNIILQTGKWNEDGIRAVAIDNSITCISSKQFPDRIDNYLEKVRKFLNDVDMQNIVDARNSYTVNEIVKYLEMCTGCTFSNDDRDQIVFGLKRGVDKVRNNVSQHTFHFIYEKIERMIAGDWENVWADGLAKIDISFLNQVVEVFKHN